MNYANYLSLGFYLLVAHALCDYPLQGEFLARGKNHKNPIEGMIPWQWPLAMHALIHAGFVGFILGNAWYGVAEFFLHCLIDYGKCNGDFDFSSDQRLHLWCKGFYLMVYVTIINTTPGKL